MVKSSFWNTAQLLAHPADRRRGRPQMGGDTRHISARGPMVQADLGRVLYSALRHHAPRPLRPYLDRARAERRRSCGAPAPATPTWLCVGSATTLRAVASALLSAIGVLSGRSLLGESERSAVSTQTSASIAKRALPEARSRIKSGTPARLIRIDSRICGTLRACRRPPNLSACCAGLPCASRVLG
jgi:hypothetical protein